MWIHGCLIDACVRSVSTKHSSSGGRSDISPRTSYSTDSIQGKHSNDVCYLLGPFQRMPPTFVPLLPDPEGYLGSRCLLGLRGHFLAWRGDSSVPGGVSWLSWDTCWCCPFVGAVGSGPCEAPSSAPLSSRWGDFRQEEWKGTFSGRLRDRRSSWAGRVRLPSRVAGGTAPGLVFFALDHRDGWRLLMSWAGDVAVDDAHH